MKILAIMKVYIPIITSGFNRDRKTPKDIRR